MTNTSASSPTGPLPAPISGVAAGVACYSLWGFFPAYFPLLAPAGAVEILAHRIVWTCAVMAVVLLATRQARTLRSLDRRSLATLGAAAVFIAINWGVYVYAINSARVSEAALGYFINPLVSVLLGVWLFRERLQRMQKSAVGVAALAVAVLTIGYGQVPYLSLILALSFGLYGVMKKHLRIPATVSLAAESLMLAPLAAGYLWWLHHTGSGTFTTGGASHSVLLISTGMVTALPLLLFGTAAQRIPLALLGMLQYITPLLQLTWAVAVVREPLDGVQWGGFGLVLVAVLIFSGTPLVTHVWRDPAGGYTRR